MFSCCPQPSLNRFAQVRMNEATGGTLSEAKLVSTH